MRNELIKVKDDSAGATTTDENILIDNPEASGCDLYVNVSQHNPDGNAGSLTVTIQGVDAFGNKYTILAGTAIVTTTTQKLQVGRALTASPNAVANAHLPPKLNINLARSANAHPMKFTVSLALIK